MTAFATIVIGLIALFSAMLAAVMLVSRSYQKNEPQDESRGCEGCGNRGTLCRQDSPCWECLQDCENLPKWEPMV